MTQWISYKTRHVNFSKPQGFDLVVFLSGRSLLSFNFLHEFPSEILPSTLETPRKVLRKIEWIHYK